MKRTHILNLKSEIDAQTRLEVYREAWELAKNTRLFMEQGFCFGLPMVLWGLDHYNDLAPDGKKWCHGHTGLAFPEVTHEVLKDLDTYESRMHGNDRRIKYLEEWISKLTFG